MDDATKVLVFISVIFAILLISIVIAVVYIDNNSKQCIQHCFEILPVEQCKETCK